MRRRRIESISEVTHRIIERADPRGRRHSARIVDAWSAAVGPDIAKHTHGVALRDGELLVFVDSPAWANELSLMTDRLLNVIRVETGQDLVRSIRFAVSKRVAEKRAEQTQADATEGFYRPTPVVSVTLSESEYRQAVGIAASVRDEELREVALRVMIKDLEWKKGSRTQSSAQTRTEGATEHNSDL